MLQLTAFFTCFWQTAVRAETTTSFRWVNACYQLFLPSYTKKKKWGYTSLKLEFEGTNGPYITSYCTVCFILKCLCINRSRGRNWRFWHLWVCLYTWENGICTGTLSKIWDFRLCCWTVLCTVFHHLVRLSCRRRADLWLALSLFRICTPPSTM